MLLLCSIQMLRPEEVEMLVCGNPELDMDALRKVTVYDGYTKNDSVIRLVTFVSYFTLFLYKYYLYVVSSLCKKYDTIGETATLNRFFLWE